MRKICLWLTALLCLLLLPSGAMAAKEIWQTVTVTRAETDTPDAVERLAVYSASGGKYLFLPGGWDTGSLRFWCSGTGALTLNDEAVTSGDVVSCLTPGASVKVGVGKKSFTLKVLQGDQVGSVFMTTASGSLKKIEAKRGNEETGSIVINDENGSLLTAQALTQVRCHGNSSFTTFKKKSYQFKLESKKNLFGMGKAKTWLLISCYRDRSFLRNAITSDLASYAGLPYSPQMVHVSLYVNGEYRGLYLLSEKVQVNSARVDIDDLEKETEALNDQPLSDYDAVGRSQAVGTKLGSGRYYDIPNSPEDITGGYLFELEWYSVPWQRGGTAYRSKHNMFIYLKSPKYCSKSEYEYITGLAQSLENAIFAKDGIDPDTGKHYSEIVNVESLVLKLTLEEVVKNYDGNRTSQYFYKPADSESTLLQVGPVWDYDSSYGCFRLSKYPDTDDPEGLSVTMGKSLDKEKTRCWYPAFYRHTEIQESVRQAYIDKYRHGISILLGEETDPTGTLRSLEEYAAPIASAAAMDTIRWPFRKISPNEAYSGKDLDTAVTFLRSWLTQRRDFLDEKWELTDADRAGK